MKQELREKIIQYNRKVKATEEKATDFETLLSALPPGQIKNLMKDETTAGILEKYGISA